MKWARYTLLGAVVAAAVVDTLIIAGLEKAGDAIVSLGNKVDQIQEMGQSA